MAKKQTVVKPNKDTVITGALFLIGEAEIEIGKLTTPQLTQWARQNVADSARGYLRTAKEQLNTLLDENVEKVSTLVEEDVVILDDDTES